MFDAEFLKTIGPLSSNPELPLQLWKELKSFYSREDRHYHNINHLDHLLTELLAVKDEIEDWPVLMLSVAYHDSIYNTLKQDNEEKSAKYALDKIGQLHLSQEQVLVCKEQILATKSHQLSENNDTNFFIDADLSILGAPFDIYHKYTDAIRKEYNFYPDFLYKPGRKKVLRHFLDMKKIYKTDIFLEKYEEAARRNMEAELSVIS
jgi:predicted metal-dependent HD superfamily phosphohydrolase